MARKRKPKFKADVTDRLHRAAYAWLKKKGGNGVVSSGPFIISSPCPELDEARQEFFVAIKFSWARKPTPDAIRKEAGR